MILNKNINFFNGCGWERKADLCKKLKKYD